jgi:hypothetical protein
LNSVEKLAFPAETVSTIAATLTTAVFALTGFSNQGVF